jgi:hypothetical protein
MTLIRRLIRTDGTTLELERGLSWKTIHELLGTESVDTVPLHHLGQPLHVMIVDDNGYETKTVRHHPGHFEVLPVRACKPVNVEATRLYHANCRPGTTHQIVGDVLVMPDEDFA